MSEYERFKVISDTVEDVLRILRPRSRRKLTAILRYVDRKGLEGFEKARKEEP